jgi:uncharacterized protein (DUF1778 family)
VSTNAPPQIRAKAEEKTSTTRLNLRVDPTVKALLRSAAKLRKASLTGFILHSSQVAAESVLAEQTRFVLPAAQWRAFNAALDAPAKEIPALRQLLTKPSVFDR